MTYRELQQAIKNLRDNGIYTPALNSKRDVLQQFWSDYCKSVESSFEVEPETTSDSRESNRTAPTVAAYAVYLATIVVGVLILWLLDIPLLALKFWRFVRQPWIDFRLQLQYLEWPQVWLPAMQLASW